MSEELYAITGATGALGSHIAEQLVSQGKRVRALVRPTSDTEYLSSIGVELVEGDLNDAASAQTLVSDATHVFHCAAKTDNWGSWDEYQRGNISTTRRIVDACAAETGVKRLVHMSTVSVYGHPSPPAGKLVDEDAEIGQKPWIWDYYALSKIEAEKIVHELGQRATIIRSTSFFGTRDMSFLPRLMRTIRKGGMWIFGSGDNLQNVMYVGDVAEMAIMAAANEQAAGQTYNCCTGGEISQRELIDSLCEATNSPRVTRKLPRGFAHLVAFIFELGGKAVGKKETPKLTRHALWVFVRPVHFSSEKAEREIGWKQNTSTRDGVQRTVDWLKSAAPDLFDAR